MLPKKLVSDSVDFAYSEIEKFGLPTKLHFDLSLRKAEEIALRLGAGVDIASVGVCLMDIKLGEAFAQKRLNDHVRMGTEASKVFLSGYSLSESDVEKILNCVEAHHGTVPYSCLESEIVANADCYRFIHPSGVLEYIGTVSKRPMSFEEAMKQVESKLDEKYAILSLPFCKEELADYHSWFKAILLGAVQR